MLQACLLLQHLPLLQEVIHKFFSYIYCFFCYIFSRILRGRVCLYCPHVLGGREACLGGGCRLWCFAWAGKFLHCFRGGAVGGGVTPTLFIKCDFENVALLASREAQPSAALLATNCRRQSLNTGELLHQYFASIHYINTSLGDFIHTATGEVVDLFFLISDFYFLNACCTWDTKTIRI